MFKPKKFRCEKYRKWIRTLPCLVTKTHHESQCAHIRHGTGGGMGLKPSDDWCVPLHWREHILQHEIGEQAYWEDKLDKAKDVAQKLHRLWVEDEHERDAMAYELIARF